MKNKFSIAMTLAVLMAMLVTSLALADNVVNNVTIGGTDTFTAPGSTIVGYKINTAAAGDSQSGCNASDGSPATVTLSVPAGVTASTTSLTFTACNVFQNVTFSSSTPGNYAINVSHIADSGSGSYNDQADFTLYVLAGSTSTPSPTPPPTDTPTPTPIPDTTAPVITPNVSGTLGNNGWYTSDVTVSWSVVDNESAISSSTGCGSTTINADTAGTTLTCSATSAGGTSSKSVTINRDATAPSISAVLDKSPDGVTGWFNIVTGAPTVNFTCSDATSGLAGACPASHLFGDGADQVYSQTVSDLAGNSASAGVTNVDVDLTAPSISAGLDKSPDGVTGWFNIVTGAPTVNFTCSDATSGLAGTCPASHLFGDGADQVYSQTVSDLAGNSASAGVTNVDVDTTKPSITITTPASGASYLLNQVVASSYSCSDGSGSGIATCTGPVASGSNIDTASAGSKNFTVNASDVAGNTNSANNSYTVAYKVCALYDQTKAHKSGSTVPVKLQLCDVNGVNYSSSSIVVQAKTVSKVDNTASAILDDSGAANSPDMNFRYDTTLNGYIFNLSTKGFTTGTWKVTFTVGGVSDASYYVKFDVK